MIEHDKIDIVIPWVDSNDVKWQEKKHQFDTRNNNVPVNNDMRYRDWGTLKYVLRSIEKYMPWYNKIYIITEGHYPEWLDVQNTKIQLVTHDEIYFDKSHLPTFSSPSIEMNLVNIKGLAEKFIYFNDDTMVLKPLERERFFCHDKPVDFLSHGWFSRNRLFEKLRGMNEWAHSIKNNIDLINKKYSVSNLTSEQLYHKSYSFKVKFSNFLLDKVYKKFLWFEHWHHPQPYLKSTLASAREVFLKEMMTCSQNRFRHKSDLNQYLYRYLQLASGNFSPYKHDDGLYVKIENQKDMDAFVADMSGYAFGCPNDSVSDKVSAEEQKYIMRTLVEKLEKLFPEKSSLER